MNYAALTVLVIEDEAFTRDLICRLLREIGVRSLVVAANGKQGLMEVIRARPDMIFCDVHMDTMDGKQFLQTVRGTKARGVSTTPIVFLTADSNLETVRFAKELAVDGYLVKPVSLKQMRDRIDVIIAANPSLAERIGAPPNLPPNSVPSPYPTNAGATTGRRTRLFRAAPTSMAPATIWS